MMQFIYSIFGYPLGWIMWLCYKILPSYALALILFTLLTRLILLPFSIKQQKSTVRMKLIQPKIIEIQTKYANNREKMQQELENLYARENYNPMSGCTPMLIQFPILFGLIDVIYKPLTHIARLSAEAIAPLLNMGVDMGLLANTKEYSAQITMVGAVQKDPSAFAALGQDLINQCTSIDLQFLGLNLGEKPTLALNVLILIPILAGVTSFLSSWISMKATGNDSTGAGTMKTMMVMMPLMMAWFTLQVPAGVGIYWIISNLVMMIQSLILNKVYNPTEMAAKITAEEEERKERERQEKIAARKLLKEQGMEHAASALSQKEIDRQKLQAARKRDAEKYGDYPECFQKPEDDKKKK
ncbi:MAG: YidC/Oxa1 family membrane protein insertase [Oscillospiraceae bacterium]|nr:YidC/Oxa1 family membrane protein insertase [Oscillospiraceae bacterium]